MAFLYRSFLIAFVVGISWFSWLKHTEKRDRTIRIQDLRECFQRREFAPNQPPEPVRTHFLQALVKLHESQQAERSLGWWRTKDVSSDWYVHEALQGLDATDSEISLIGLALQNAYFELQRQDALALQESRDLLRRGQPPLCTRGLFAGDTLVIGYQLSPVVIPDLRNHPANFILQPATVWALQQDVLESSNLALIRQWHRAGLLSDAVLADLTTMLSPAPKSDTAQKND